MKIIVFHEKSSVMPYNAHTTSKKNAGQLIKKKKSTHFNIVSLLNI